MTDRLVAKMNGQCMRQFDNTASGNFDAYQTVTVRKQLSGDLAPLFSGPNPPFDTLLPNPFKADNLGRFQFYLDNGEYKFEFGDPVIDSATIENVQVYNLNGIAINDADSDGIAYYRQAGSWVQIVPMPAEPQDGGLYAREDETWKEFAEMHYPFKVGDVYRSNTGVIDANRDFQLDGIERNNVDWPLIAGTVGYPIGAGGITGFTGDSRSIPAILSSSDTYVNSDGSLSMSANLSSIVISTDASRVYSSSISTPESIRLYYPLDSPSTDIIAMAASGNMYTIDNLGNFTNINTNIPVAGTGDIRYTDLVDGILTYYISTTSRGLFNVNDYTYTTVNSLPPVGNQAFYAKIFKGQFYIAFRNSSAGSSGVYRTSDFVTKEIVYEDFTTTSIYKICSNNDALYIFKSELPQVFKVSNNGSDFSDVSYSAGGAGSQVSNIHNNRDAIYYRDDSSTGIDVGYIITNSGLTIYNFPVAESVNGSTRCNFDNLTSEIVARNRPLNKDSRFKALFSSGETFTPPDVPKTADEQFYYVRGK